MMYFLFAICIISSLNKMHMGDDIECCISLIYIAFPLVVIFIVINITNAKNAMNVMNDAIDATDTENITDVTNA